jgi:hypothetical protein
MIMNFVNIFMACRDSAVSMVTHYGLDGQGIESCWGMRFSASVQTGPQACTASSSKGSGCLSRG